MSPDAKMRAGLRVFFSGGASTADPTVLVRVMNAAREELESREARGDVPVPLLEGRLPQNGYIWREVEGADQEFDLVEVLEVVDPHSYPDPEEAMPTPGQLFEDWGGAEEMLWEPYGRHGPRGGFHVHVIEPLRPATTHRWRLWAQVPEGTGRIVLRPEV